DGRPEAVDDEAGDPRGAGAGEAALGLLEVEREVTGLVADDAGEEIVQDRVILGGGEELVAGERRQLVDRAPGHVHGDEVGPRLRQQRRRRRLDALGEARARATALRRRMAGGVEEAAERAAVERLLVEPAGEERRDLGLVERARLCELALVDDRVAL